MGVIKTIGNKQYQKDDAGDWYEVPVKEDNPITKVVGNRTYQKDSSGNWFDMGEVVKKKEPVSDWVQKTFGTNGSSPSNGLGSEKDTQIQPKNEATGRTLDKFGDVLVDQIDHTDPAKSIAKQYDRDIQRKQEEDIEEPSVTSYAQRLGDIRKLKEQKTNLPDNLFPTVDAANHWLYQSGKQFDATKLTDVLAMNKVMQRKMLDEADKQGGSFDDIVFGLNKVDKDNTSEAKKGQIIDEALNNPLFAEKADHSADFAQKYHQAKFDLYRNYPSYGAKKVGELIGQKLEDKRMVGWLYANPNLTKVQKAVDMLKEDGKWGPEEQEVFDQMKLPIEMGGADQLIPLPDVMHQAGYGIQKGLESFDASARDLVSKVTGGFLDPHGNGLFQNLGLIESNEDRTKRLEQEKDATPHVEPKRWTTKLFGGVANFTGQMTPLILGEAMGVPTKLNLTLNFEGNNADRSRELFPNNAGKQNLYTLLGTTFDAFAMEALPTKKAFEGFKKFMAPEVESVVKGLSDKTITEDVARKTLLEKSTDYLKRVGVNNTKTAAVLSGFNLAHNGLDAAFGKRKFNVESELNDAMDNYATNWLNSTFLSGLASHKGAEQPTNGKMFKRIADNPEYYRDLIGNNKNISPEDKKDMLEKLDRLQVVNMQLSGKKLDPTKHEEYLNKDMQQFVAQKAIKQSPDKTLAKEDERKVKIADIEKEHILNPKSNTELVEDLYDHLPKGSQQKLTTEDKFDKNKVTDYLKYIAQQSNGLDENWQPHEDGRVPRMSDIPNSIKEAANKKFEKEIDAAQPKEEAPTEQPSTIPNEKFPIEEEFKNGEQVESLMDAETRLSNGERIFAFHEMDEGGQPIEIRNVGDLKNHAPDQLIAIQRKENPFETPESTIPEKNKINFSFQEDMRSKDHDGTDVITYDLKSGSDIIGAVEIFAPKDKGYRFSSVSVNEPLRGKGLGKEVYKEMNDKSIRDTGKPLWTKKETLNEDSERVWKSFIKSGDAEVLPNGDYSFKEKQKFKTKEEIFKLPDNEREKAIDDLIYGKHESSRDAFNRQTGNPASLGRYALSDFIKQHDISGNKISKKLLENISKHPYFDSIRLYVTDKLEEGVKGEALVTAGLMKVNPNVDAETMAHEMMHFLTAKILDNPYESLLSSEKSFRNDINNIIKKFDPDLSYLDRVMGKLGYKRSEYAKELIAEAFTGSEFSKDLQGKEIKVLRTKNIDKTLIQRIVDKIIEFFGGKISDKTITVEERQNVVDALREAFIKNGSISSKRLKEINIPKGNDVGSGERYGSLQSRTVDIKAATQRMLDAGFTESEISEELKKRGIGEPPKSSSIPVQEKETQNKSNEATQQVQEINKQSPQSTEETGSTGKPPIENTTGADELPFGRQETSGIAHDIQEARTYDVKAPKPERGEGVTVEESVKHGQDLLESGSDPNKAAADFAKDKKVSYDDISLVRAKQHQLERVTNEAIDKYGENSKEAQAATKDERDWYNNTVKPMQTEWSKIGVAQQGQVDIDTGSFAGLRRAKEQFSGRPMNENERAKAKELSSKVSKLTKEVENIKGKLTEVLDNGGETKPPKDIKEIAKKVANDIRKLKASRPDTFSAASPATIVWDGAIEIVAKAVEAGGTIAKALADGIQHIRESDWYKGLPKDKKEQAEKDFTDSMPKSEEQKRIEKLQKELDELEKGNVKPSKEKREPSEREKELREKIKEAKKELGLNEKVKPPKGTEKNKDAEDYYDLNAKLIDKKDNKFTPEEASAIWNYAKKEYLDKGASFDEMISGVANDLGLKTEQVRDALTAPKGAKKITDAMYKKQNERNMVIQRAKDWAKAGKTNVLVKFLKSIPRFFFGLKVFGHGTVGMITHAGINIYDPVEWKRYWPVFFKQFKFAYGKQANYEKAMQDLQNDPEYIFWKRNGLTVDPSERYDDYQFIAKFFNKLGRVGRWLTAGDRGFNALKVYRLERAKAIWKGLSEAEKKDPDTPKMISKLVNHSTGTTNLKVSEAAQTVFFAPNLELSRWNKLIVDPVKAAKTMTEWNSATSAEKVRAKIIAKRAARIFGTYIGALVVNQSLLSLTGSSQSINFLDPTKSDWLKFKVGGRTVDMTGGMLSLFSFVVRMGISATGTGKKSGTDTFKDEVFGYVRGKASPFTGTLVDLKTHHDFAGNTLPFFNDKPLHSWNKKLSLKEYLEKQQTPIPISNYFTDMEKQLKDQGLSHPSTMDIIKSIFVAAVVGGAGVHVGEEPTAKSTPFTDEDKKDPTFKFFLDKGLELPNTAPTSEVITDEDNGTKKKLSDYPKEIQDKYSTIHKGFLKEELQNAIDNGVYEKTYKDAKGEPENQIYLKPPKGDYEEIEVKKIPKNDLPKLLRLAQDKATERAKKEVFGQE